MLTVKRVTENPADEQWRLLSQFAYPTNIERYFEGRALCNVPESVVELVAGSIRQAEAYFSASKQSPLDISPLLLYYGATNLMMAAYAMVVGEYPTIKNHGMLIPENGEVHQIAEVQVLPRSPNNGALQLFCNAFSDACNLTNGARWTMGEILGSIPDLKHDFEGHYRDAAYFTIPVDVVKTRERTLERIPNIEFARYGDPETTMNMIPGLSEAYLAPQFKPDFVMLFRKRQGVEIGTYSISGQKYLQIGHRKNGQMLNPEQIILMYMGLYVLGFLPRYRPELWNPFVRSDVTGEKYIIEKFTAICFRHFPNLVLDQINGVHVQFVNQIEGVIDLT